MLVDLNGIEQHLYLHYSVIPDSTTYEDNHLEDNYDLYFILD